MPKDVWVPGVGAARPTSSAAPPRCPNCGGDLYVLGLFRPGELVPARREMVCWSERRTVTIDDRAAPAAERED